VPVISTRWGLGGGVSEPAAPDIGKAAATTAVAAAERGWGLMGRPKGQAAGATRSRPTARHEWSRPHASGTRCLGPAHTRRPALSLSGRGSAPWPVDQAVGGGARGCACRHGCGVTGTGAACRGRASRLCCAAAKVGDTGGGAQPCADSVHAAQWSSAGNAAGAGTLSPVSPVRELPSAAIHRMPCDVQTSIQRSSPTAASERDTAGANSAKHIAQRSTKLTLRREDRRRIRLTTQPMRGADIVDQIKSTRSGTASSMRTTSSQDCMPHPARFRSEAARRCPPQRTGLHRPG
jgi:hypothetical protein